MDAAMVGGALFGFLIFAVIMLLIAGLIMKVSVRLVEGFSPSYGRALLVVVIAAVIGFVLNIVISMVMGVGGMAAGGAMGGSDPEAAAAAMAAMGTAMLGVFAITLVASLIVNAFCINWLIKHPDGRAIGFGKSLLVALLYLVILTVIGMVLGFVLGAVLGLVAAGLAAAA